MTARTDRLRALLAERILVLDGATGTYLQGRDLGPADFGGEAYEGCNEHLVLTRPDVVREMHEGYLAAGADIVETTPSAARASRSRSTGWRTRCARSTPPPPVSPARRARSSRRPSALASSPAPWVRAPRPSR